MLLASVFSPFLWDHFFINYLSKYKGFYMIGAKIIFFLPWFLAARGWLQVHFHKYKITSERLMEREGIFSRTTGELELFRVKDITFHEPFILRVFGLGDVILDTSDKSTPIVVLHAIKNPHEVKDLLRKYVDIMRNTKGVREFDM